MSEWREYKLSYFIEINPKVILKSGIQHSFVEMKDLNESQKYVHPSQIKDIKGGARFQNSDTLFARITPCLQNGKICQVKGLNNSIGFGSTEFLVFRGKEGISNTDFVYYLSRYDVVRKFAEQNMIGTSGRQRVSKDAFENIELFLPDLPTQTAIAEILSSLDDKIELNNKINQELETLAQTLFKQWFIDFEFPNENGEPYKSSGGEMVNSELGEIPKGWEIGLLNKIATLEKGNVKPYENPEKEYSHYSLPDFDNGKKPSLAYGNEILSSKYKITPFSILVSKLNPRIPRVWIITDCDENSICSTEFQVIKPKKIEYFSFICTLCSSNTFFDSLKSKVTGTSSSHQRVNPNDIINYKLSIPKSDILIKFDSIISDIFISKNKNLIENSSLIITRDTLLPKLISGELEINEITN